MESIIKSSSEQHILSLCEKILEPQGFRAVDVDCKVGPRSIIRVFIERAHASAEAALENDSQAAEISPSASLGDCAHASRLLGPVLESDSTFPSAFDLEVSSPGLDRRLRLRSDFEANVGQEVKLKLVESIPGLGANPKGKLTEVSQVGLKVDFKTSKCRSLGKK